MSNGKGDKWRQTNFKNYVENWPKSMGRKKQLIDKGDLELLLKKNPQLEYKEVPCNGAWWYEIYE